MKVTFVAVLPLVAASSVAAAQGMAMAMPPASRPTAAAAAVPHVDGEVRSVDVAKGKE